MSYVNQDLLKMQKRRHSVKRVTPEEAIEAANEVVDKANDQIAKALAHAKAWERVATELYQDNQAKDQRIAELEAEKVVLEAEVDRLRKKATRKSGRHKGVEWEAAEV